MLKIRPEKHPLKPGETFNPRHHGQHYHIESKRDVKKSWENNDNIEIIKPNNYKPKTGTKVPSWRKFSWIDLMKKKL